MLRSMAAIESALRHQRGALFAWSPVCLATGIGLFFSLRFEPEFWQSATLALIALPLVYLAYRLQSGFQALVIATILVLAGFTLATVRAHSVAAPRLDLPYNGAVEGRIVAIDRSSSDALRLTLDQIVMPDYGQRPPPHRIRISLHGDAKGFVAVPHAVISLKARLAPPSGPAEPGGFDFQRHAWFQRLGAVGYTRAPIRQLRPPESHVTIDAIRHHLSKRIRTLMPGDAGAVAAAITTGDRSAMSQEIIFDLRTTNLAHLLAISGLHMGLLVGVVFAGLRIILTLSPAIALRIAVKKIAAIGALIAASFYLALSGASIATERAFVMAAVVLVAVVLDRRAISMRAIAIAALIVLVLRPESLLSPGFQMSFAATTALVWVYSFLRQSDWPGSTWVKSVLAVVLTSFVAGAATAPFAAAHFNGYAAYGLFANVLAVPIMGLVVMPAAVLAFCLAPIGAEIIGLTLMGWGLEWILLVAEYFAGFDGARTPVPAPPALVLPVFAIGALFLMLWQAPLRFIGVLPIGIAFVVWFYADRPDVLIDETGKIVGGMTQEGRALSRPKGRGFTARIWLENDGDPVDQETAFLRGDPVSKAVFRMKFGRQTVWHLYGKTGWKYFDGCEPEDILISSIPLRQDLDCLGIDPKTLSKTGAMALWLNDEGLRIQTIAQTRGARFWAPPEQHQ